jgi:hypothetical protein
MSGMRTAAIGLISGAALVVLTLLVAFVYVVLFPEGGDSWDAVYFFTHPAFYVLFGAGFAVGVGLLRWKASRAKAN